MSKSTFFIFFISLFCSRVLFCQIINNDKDFIVRNETTSIANNRIFINPIRVKVKVFPLEITSQLYFHIAGNANSIANLKLIDSGGKIYFNQDVPVGQTQKILVNNFPRGTYSVCVSIGGIIITNQVVIFI
jgi:predicted secreted protein